MTRFVRVLAVGFALALSARAEAQLITFDELSPTDNPILGSVVCADGTGFRFSSNHFHLIGNTFITDYSFNGTTHIGYESGRGFPITMERVGGGTFSLLSLDAAEFYSSPSIDRPDAEVLTITGYQADGGTVSFSVNLDGLRDGPGGVDDFQHVVLPTTFVNLTSVVFTGLRAGDLSGGVAIDNIEYQLDHAEVLPACVATPLPSDTPTVSITRPLPGNVAGTVVVEASATDNVGVTSVQLLLDGVALGGPLLAAPYATTWDTTTVPDGAHTLTAEARDAANNVGTTSVVVTVRNSPVIPASPHYLELDGVDDYLQVADDEALSFIRGTADAPLTFEMWFRPDAMVNHQLLGKWGERPNREYRLRVIPGGIRLDLIDSSALAVVSAFTATNQSALIGSWHHLAVTYDGRGGATAADGITIYIDGVAVPLVRFNNAAYVAMENTTAPVLIGREGPSWNQYDGALDEIRLWNVARTPGEIQASIATELTGTEPGLIAYWRLDDGTGVSAIDDSPAEHTATLFNGPIWNAGGGMAPPDGTAPDIFNISTSSPTTSTVTVTFNTSEAATAWVSYTPTTACPCVDVYSATVGTTHSITLTGLAANTTYQFVVQATDAAGNLQVAPAQTFTTLPLAVDATQPSVSITRPLPGNVAGTVVAEANATDNVGVTSVQLLVDGVALGAPLLAAPYATTWDTTTVADGAHTLTAEARDAAGNVGTAAVIVTVRNAPAPPASPHYLEFDGIDDYLSVLDDDRLSVGQGTTDTPLTIETWFRPDVMANHQLLGKWGGSGNREYRLRIAPGAIRLDLADSSAQAVVSAFTATNQSALIGSWHHLAVTYDGRGGATAANGITIYIDGVAVPLVRFNNTAYVAMENTTAPVLIGREGPSWFQYDGALDEIRLWNVARTPVEIQASMATELTGIEPGLIAYWRLDDGTGVSAFDDSPAEHTATLFNGPIWNAGGPIVSR